MFRRKHIFYSSGSTSNVYGTLFVIIIVSSGHLSTICRRLWACVRVVQRGERSALVTPPSICQLSESLSGVIISMTVASGSGSDRSSRTVSSSRDGKARLMERSARRETALVDPPPEAIQNVSFSIASIMQYTFYLSFEKAKKASNEKYLVC